MFPAARGRAALAPAVTTILASQPSAAIPGSKRLEGCAPRRLHRASRVQCALQTAGSCQTNKPGIRAGFVVRRHFLRLRRARVLELKDTPSA